LSVHPEAKNVAPLLEVLKAAPAEDTHLVYGTRVALREQLTALRTLDQWQAPALLAEENADRLADLALAGPNGGAARLLLRQVQAGRAVRGGQAGAVHHAARYGDAETTKALFAFVRDPKRGPLKQADLFRAMERGAQERGRPLPDDAEKWAG